MNVKLFSPAIFLFTLFACTRCGPEAETGAVFSKYSAHACSAASPSDTIPPDLDTSADWEEVAEKKVNESGIPAGQYLAAEAAFLMGKFDPKQHPDFVTIQTPYTQKTGMILHREAYAAFKKLYNAARREGITLRIISSTRTFDYQKGLWERKWSNLANQIKDPKARTLKILEYSAMPGTSRHHWGTDIDLNNLNNASFNPGGPYARMYEWMEKHAAEYGFFQPYSPKNEDRPTGYNEEKWHWSYQPLADRYLKQYEQLITDDMIVGFSGAETATSIGIVQNYVLGVAERQ